MYTSAHHHTVDCSKSIRGTHTDMVNSYLFAHELILIYVVLFVVITYMAITCEVDISVSFVF